MESLTFPSSYLIHDTGGKNGSIFIKNIINTYRDDIHHVYYFGSTIYTMLEECGTYFIPIDNCYFTDHPYKTKREFLEYVANKIKFMMGAYHTFIIVSIKLLDMEFMLSPLRIFIKEKHNLNTTVIYHPKDVIYVAPELRSYINMYLITRFETTAKMMNFYKLYLANIIFLKLLKSKLEKLEDNQLLLLSSKPKQWIIHSCNDDFTERDIRKLLKHLVIKI